MLQTVYYFICPILCSHTSLWDLVESGKEQPRPPNTSIYCTTLRTLCVPTPHEAMWRLVLIQYRIQHGNVGRLQSGSADLFLEVSKVVRAHNDFLSLVSSSYLLLLVEWRWHQHTADVCLDLMPLCICVASKWIALKFTHLCLTERLDAQWCPRYLCSAPFWSTNWRCQVNVCVIVVIVIVARHGACVFLILLCCLLDLKCKWVLTAGDALYELCRR